MASNSDKLRKNYEFKLGKKLIEKLSNEQISLLSKYYNSLSKDEQKELDVKIFKGDSNELSDMAEGFINESNDNEIEPEEDQKIDDLLKQIREEVDDKAEVNSDEKSGAIVVLPKEKQNENNRSIPSDIADNFEDDSDENLVEEEIDSRILEILGLTEVTDFTYGEYKTLLREKAAAGRMGASGMSTETIELVTNEFKRVKNKEEGKFKIKPKTINISSVFNKKEPSPQKQQLDPKKLLPAGEEKKKDSELSKGESSEKKSGLDKILTSILGTLNDIKSLLNDQLNADRLAAENLRKRQEISRKRRREDESESKKGEKDADVKSLTLPAFGFFDAIKRYFGNILAGSFVVGLLKWLTDPKNKKSVDNFKQFFINQGPLILGGILALALLPVASTLLSFTGAILLGIPKLIGALSFLASPAGLAALATIAVKARESQEINRLAEEEAKRRKIEKDQVLRERESARNNPLNILGEALSGGGLSISGGGGISLAESMNVDPKAKRKPIRQLSPGEIKKFNSIIESYKNKYAGSGRKLSISGIGSVVAGRNFFGMPEIKYFDPSGNQLNKIQWAQRMADAGNPVGAKAAAGVDVKPTPSPKDPYAGADGLQRQLDDLTKPPAVQPTTPLMSGLPPSAAQPGTGPSGNQVGSTPIPDQQGLPPLPPTNTLPGKQHYGAFREGGRKHAGVDFDISGPNAKFYSRIGGVVVGNPFRYGDDGWGIDIFNNQLGVYERIAEANKILVKNGQTVQPGQAVAQGESRTGVIHYEIRTKIEGGFENTLDPIAFLRNPTTQQQTAQLSPTTTPGTSITPGTPTFMAPFKMPQGAAGPLPIPSQGTSGAAGGSSSIPGQAKVPSFSSEDPNNVTTMVVKGIYNVVG